MSCKTIISIGASLFLFIDSNYAQFTIASFSLDSFRLPSLERRTLEFQGSLSGLRNSLDVSGIDNFTSQSRISSTLGAAYTKYTNRPDLQSFFSLSASPRFSFQSNQYDFPLSTYDRNQNSILLYQNGYARKYKGPRFIELGLETSLNHEYETNTSLFSEFYPYKKLQRLGFTLSPELALGKGRIEPVSDYALALFMMQDAVEAGVDPTLLNEDDLIAFALLMAQVQNERVFDSRKQLIYELRTLYNFMTDKGWVVPNDPGFFTVLTDNWLLAYSPNRSAGKRWRYGINPSYNLDKYKAIRWDSLNGPDQLWHTLAGKLFVQFDREDPVNIHKDNFRRHEVFTIIGKTIDERDVFEDDTDLYAGIENSIGKNWYPNTRTTITALARLNYLYSNQIAPSSSFDESRHSFLAGLSGSTNYFLSYKVRLAVNAGVTYSLNDYDTIVFGQPFPNTQHNTSHGFNATLNATITAALY